MTLSEVIATIKIFYCFNYVAHAERQQAGTPREERDIVTSGLELETNLREVFIITEKALGLQ